MTSPNLPRIVAPFGVVFTARTGNNNLAPLYTQLPEGVSTLTITWDQPQELRIMSSPRQQAATRVQMGSIPAGSGKRMLIVSGVGVSAGEERYISLQADGLPVLDSQATLQVITMPLQ